MKNLKTGFFHMRKSIELGKQIQELLKQEGLVEDFVNAFRNGATATKLVSQFNLSIKLHEPEDLVRQGVFIALKGHHESIRGVEDPYSGLLPLDEYEEIAKKHAHPPVFTEDQKTLLKTFIENPEYKRGSKYNLIKITKVFKEKFPDAVFCNVSLWKVIGKKNQQKNAT